MGSEVLTSHRSRDRNADYLSGGKTLNPNRRTDREPRPAPERKRPWSPRSSNPTPDRRRAARNWTRIECAAGRGKWAARAYPGIAAAGEEEGKWSLRERDISGAAAAEGGSPCFRPVATTVCCCCLPDRRKWAEVAGR